MSPVSPVSPVITVVGGTGRLGTLLVPLLRAGGARAIPQGEFTPETLARQIEAIASDPQALANAAARSLSVGRPNAASDLADLVERVGGGLSALPEGLEPRKAAVYAGTGVPA